MAFAFEESSKYQHTKQFTLQLCALTEADGSPALSIWRATPLRAVLQSPIFLYLPNSNSKKNSN